MPLDPIVAVITVPVTPTEAFVGFTARMGEWWDPMLSPDGATFTNIAVDPEGDVATVHGDEHYVCGRVTTWDPPSLYVQDFWLGHAAEDPTTLAVTFDEVDGEAATTVRLEHSGWADGSEALRDNYTHWDILLARFAAHVS
ncbi:MAG: SRPBCC domain-containing protein [Nocardioides sp.]|nr:SRPBCC domain-containing protein [Nocardioides sp.]